ncbi:MAG: hypothetical protein K2W95_12255 [Candidatus Obscuribacterales bacterium]|nr:hypothetical protein [Candidatus Obscuribacterales bacterium]
MLAAWVGLPSGFVAFVLVCYFTMKFVSAPVPLLAGGIVAVSVWLYFKRLDDLRLEALLNPEPELWPVSLAVAWGILKSAFDGPIVMPGSAAGLLPWRLIKQDQAAGVLVACLSFRELLHEPENPGLLTVTATVKQEPDGTLVSFLYTSDKDAATEKVLLLTKQWLEEDLNGLIQPSI